MSAEVERQPQVFCGLREASCVCFLGRDHAGPHVCTCGGSWSIDADGRFHIHSMPQMALADIEVSA